MSDLPSLDDSVRIVSLDPQALAEVLRRNVRTYETGNTKTVPESKKFDDDKDPWHLLPWEALEDVVAVFKGGAKKYGDRNWEDPGLSYHRLFRAAMGHLVSWWLGRDPDPEFGKSHLAHAVCCCLFLMTYDKTGKGTDNRPKRNA